ncbi:hypothetical protein VSR01_36725 [Actinacidiphila sp. DG2A-62]|nr:hypothetical protein [Actinacidiphila sp. DG2A-62]MEC3998737.1 hypothetical protein [Actinacidiphila sp. DG2A-62]
MSSAETTAATSVTVQPDQPYAVDCAEAPLTAAYSAKSAGVQGSVSSNSSTPVRDVPLLESTALSSSISTRATATTPR